ncbi:hypothetical protein [Massilia scottii]|uniref:hypothetical protein n=1 Tax=Massilia scottii TaxID=3057166 RepID=UPI002796D12A|nr:hypothetical protein [Massilia sp. CCM 9029]MDQ1831887.1 hypothetical protein [Massilia sp. CCM 9029]
MSTDFLEQHARQLQREAQQTAERSAATPDDFWLNAAADNCWNGSTDEVLRIRALLAGVSDSKTRVFPTQYQGGTSSHTKCFRPRNKRLKQ